MKGNGEMTLLGALSLGSNTIGDGKNLFGSMVGEGSLAIVLAVAAVAVLAGVVIFVYKKKKSKKGEGEDE